MIEPTGETPEETALRLARIAAHKASAALRASKGGPEKAYRGCVCGHPADQHKAKGHCPDCDTRCQRFVRNHSAGAVSVLRSRLRDAYAQLKGEMRRVYVLTEQGEDGAIELVAIALAFHVARDEAERSTGVWQPSWRKPKGGDGWYRYGLDADGVVDESRSQDIYERHLLPGGRGDA